MFLAAFRLIWRRSQIDAYGFLSFPGSQAEVPEARTPLPVTTQSQRRIDTSVVGGGGEIRLFSGTRPLPGFPGTPSHNSRGGIKDGSDTSPGEAATNGIGTCAIRIQKVVHGSATPLVLEYDV